MMQSGLTHSQGRYPVGVPDLIENMDTLAALRGTMELLYDLMDLPAWVHARLAEINTAWLDAFDRMQALVQDADGGNVFAAFRLWGPGRTAKVQCDFSAMISPAMFEGFVRPYLAAQCAQLDFAMYHLDGTNALQHLDILLDMPEIDAIEWTPQAGLPGGGAPEWHRPLPAYQGRGQGRAGRQHHAAGGDSAAGRGGAGRDVHSHQRARARDGGGGARAGFGTVSAVKCR
ncbi:MAG: hypothetical protein R2854_08155 [Caldilineaceae bacterium]